MTRPAVCVSLLLVLLSTCPIRSVFLFLIILFLVLFKQRKKSKHNASLLALLPFSLLSLALAIASLFSLSVRSPVEVFHVEHFARSLCSSALSWLVLLILLPRCCMCINMVVLLHQPPHSNTGVRIPRHDTRGQPICKTLLLPKPLISLISLKLLLFLMLTLSAF